MVTRLNAALVVIVLGSCEPGSAMGSGGTAYARTFMLALQARASAADESRRPPRPRTPSRPRGWKTRTRASTST